MGVCRITHTTHINTTHILHALYTHHTYSHHTRYTHTIYIYIYTAYILYTHNTLHIVYTMQMLHTYLHILYIQYTTHILYIQHTTHCIHYEKCYRHTTHTYIADITHISHTHAYNFTPSFFFQQFWLMLNWTERCRDFSVFHGVNFSCSLTIVLKPYLGDKLKLSQTVVLHPSSEASDDNIGLPLVFNVMGYAGKIMFPDQTSYLSLFLEISGTFTKTVAQLYLKLKRVVVPTSASLVNTKILLDEANRFCLMVCSP